MMISVWNLAWIIPLSVLAGIVLAALLTAASRRDGDRR